MSDLQKAWESWSADTFEYEGTVAHRAFCAAYRQSLLDAADAIQALHPGEVKNSVVWLRARASVV